MNKTQLAHGRRIEERQRVNGQPNGYAPISEADLQIEHLLEVGDIVAARRHAVMHPDPEIARALSAKLAA